MVQEEGECEEAKGPALFDELLSQDSLATNGSVTMDDEEEETEEVPGFQCLSWNHYWRSGRSRVGSMIRCP